MKRLVATAVLLLAVTTAQAQPRLNYQLRLEPVWARVADAMGEPGSVESVEFSPDGKHLVSGTKFDNSVILWRASDGHELWRQYAAQEIERVGWSSDGRYVAAASEDYRVTVYDAATGEVHRVLEHTRGVDGLTWSNEGRLLVTGEERYEEEGEPRRGWIRVFDVEKDEEVTTIDFGDTVNELFFSQDDRYLLAVGHGAVKVIDASTWTVVQTLAPEYRMVFTSGVFSPDAARVLAVGQGGNMRGTAYLWDWRSGELLKQFNHTGKKIESVAWHPSGRYIAHAGHDPYIYVYRVDDILAFGHDYIPIAHQVWAGDNSEYIDFNADGSFLASAHQNGLVKLWVWMGEDPDINARRHDWVREQQRDAQR